MPATLANKIIEVLGFNRLTSFEINKKIVDSSYKFPGKDNAPLNAYITQCLFHLCQNGTVEKTDGKYFKSHRSKKCKRSRRR